MLCRSGSSTVAATLGGVCSSGGPCLVSCCRISSTRSEAAMSRARRALCDGGYGQAHLVIVMKELSLGRLRQEAARKLQDGDRPCVHRFVRVAVRLRCVLEAMGMKAVLLIIARRRLQKQKQTD